ncbi:EamA/RhaT family transporter [Streptomyces sp. GMY02]|uniref:EamA/RhaT family transporter n=1 Tax=Streptomyces sp. GMY02 TaxID=1333528 RepID=UPI0020B76B40|nr:EamA/RhaT family transporter [Streptomyces sp. GMY02]
MAVDADDGGRGRGGPEPEAIRFFGTSWLAHDRGYPARRIAVSFGSLAATVAACLVLRFAYQGLESANVGGFVGWLVVVMFGVCGAIAFRHTWDGYLRRPADADRDDSLRGAMTIGFIGSLAAYFLRSLKEAPGESLRRREYEKSRAARSRPSND